MIETIKYIVYRTPLLQRVMWPKYPYKINPGQLNALINLIDATRSQNAAIMEIGVAQGDTSTFLLEHLKTTGDSRPVFLLDTFDGFTQDSIDVEVSDRLKDGRPYKSFRYGDEQLFVQAIRHAGYENFRIFKGDASKFDYAGIGPIGAVLLDIDLYAPTRDCLAAIWPHLVDGGGIVVDDCQPDTAWDGSLQAVQEFSEENGLDPIRVGHKGYLLKKPLQTKNNPDSGSLAQFA